MVRRGGLFSTVAVVVLCAAACGATTEATTATRRDRRPTTTSSTSTTLPPPPTPRWAMFGDSTALSLALVSGSWEVATRESEGVGGVMELGCGIVRGGQRRYFGVEAIHDVCDAWPATWAAELDRVHPDVALVQSCQWETVDRKLAGDDTWRRLGDPVYDERVRTEYLAAADLLSSRGALVMWLTCAPFGHHPDDATNDFARRSHERARVDRLDAIIRDVAAARPATVRVVDLAAWMASRVDDTEIRADGSHYALGPGDDVVRSFLGPALVATWRDWWATHPPTG